VLSTTGTAIWPLPVPLRHRERMSYGVPSSVRDIAALQDGVLTAGQLVLAGISNETLCSRVRLGHWQRLYRGVYATFSGELSREAQLWAAVLACGDGAMLSHQTAAEAAKLTEQQSELIHVTVPTARRVAAKPGLVIHRSARAHEALHPAHLPPRTRVEETVLDLVSAARTADDAVHWLTRALGRRATTQDKLRQALGQRAKTRWRPLLTELLSPDADGIQSVLEYRYHHHVERPHGLPAGSRQARYRANGRSGYRDRVYDTYATVIELDGRLAHPAHQRWLDIHRDNAAASAGLTTLRYGWLDITEHPCHAAGEILQALMTRGYTGGQPCSPACPVAETIERGRPAA
jgi:hypothetical protein